MLSAYGKVDINELVLLLNLKVFW